MKAIAFIGMPGSGKSTISKLTADALGYELYDSDEQIELIMGMPISKIFERYGEDVFREKETAVISELSAMGNRVLSLGGGAILRNEQLISERCKVVYLERSLEKLYSALVEQAGQRPLTKTLEDLECVYGARRGIYERMADITARNENTPRETAEIIIKELNKCGY